MMVFNVCVNDTVQFLNKSINFLVEELIVMSFGCQCICVLGYLIFMLHYYNNTYRIIVELLTKQINSRSTVLSKLL